MTQRLYGRPRGSATRGTWLAAVVMLSSAGCGPAPVGVVTGEVAYKGKPVVYGSVMVIGSGKLPHYGEIKPEGNYTVEGVPLGDARLTVTSPDPRIPAPSGPDKSTGKSVQDTVDTSWRPAVDARKWFAIPSKYGDPAHSGLTIQVKAGSNRYDIALD